MPYVIMDPCIDQQDMSCIEECPVDCIYEGGRKLYIQPTECIDCGACEPACPWDAISADDAVPPEQVQFVKDNERFFTEPLPGRQEPLGMPGGSRKTGPIDADTELVREWPSVE